MHIKLYFLDMKFKNKDEENKRKEKVVISPLVKLPLQATSIISLSLFSIRVSNYPLNPFA